MRIKEESIKRLLDSISIVDVISDYVQLRKRGKNFVGLCPFHTEKTPSFSVSEEKGMFYCFGCSEGGNTVSFLMKYEKYTFVDAIENLAKKFNFQLEYDDSSYYEKDTELEKLYDYSRITARYFYDNLTKTNEGENALKYLSERGLNDEIIKTFGIGYALSSWEGLINFAEKNDLEKAIFEKLGLILKKEDGSYYDRFRGRIIYPIFSPAGRVIAFGGRILIEEENQPKYLNSPETKIYTKGKTLYGLFQSKDEIRKKDAVLLVEGYMDLISLYQNGFKNAVASAGTALTTEQVQILSRYTKNVTVIYDSDEAGQKAAARASEIMLETDIDFKIVSLPEGEDPDSFIKNHGGERMKIEIQSANDYVSFVESILMKDKLTIDNTEKLKIINKILELTSKIKDPIRRSLYVKSISEKFKIRESALMESMSKYIQQSRLEKKEEEKPLTITSEEETKPTIKEIPILEKGLLELMFEGNKELIEFILLHIPPEDFTSEHSRTIAQLIQNELEQGNLPEGNIIINKLEDDELKKLVAEIIFEKHKVSESWINNFVPDSSDEVKWKIAEDHIKKFKVEYLENQIAKNQSQLKSAIDLEEIKKLMELDKLLKQEILKIKSMKFRE